MVCLQLTTFAWEEENNIVCLNMSLPVYPIHRLDLEGKNTPALQNISVRKIWAH